MTALLESEVKLFSRTEFGPPSWYTPGVVRTGLGQIPIEATPDFTLEDPWSVMMRGVIAKLRDDGQFIGQDIYEAGIGDGRNILIAGLGIREAIGVDLEARRLALAANNLDHSYPVKLWEGDIVAWLRNIPSRQKLSGWAFVCLPQAPSQETQNSADGYIDTKLLDPYKNQWDEYGFGLNAAVLDGFAKCASKGFRMLIILSDRIPQNIREKLIQGYGWTISKEHKTTWPIQQDPDTGVAYIENAGIDDGRRFWERNGYGTFDPISARMAEERRKASVVSGKGRDELNVYHHLSVYELKIV